ncbi:MAG: dihydrolipoyl dehydrogenase [Candidatus Bathyarchaeia archaeon]
MFVSRDETMIGSTRYDVAVIGAGIGGYVSAIRSAQLGKKVVLIEKEALGGTCTNRGCIPTKTLLATTSLLGKISKAQEHGVNISEIKVDFEKMMARKDAVVNRLTQGVEYLIKKNKITLIKGRASLVSRNQILVKKQTGEEEFVDAENIIIATGSEEPKVSYAVIDEEKILTTKGALSLRERPSSLAVIGSNIYGVEFATIFKALGADVKIFESASNILPTFDAEVSRNYERILKKKGIEIHTNANIKSVRIEPDGMVGTYVSIKETEVHVNTEKVLISDARLPLSSGLGLEKVGVKLENGFVVVDNRQKTNIPNIYAVGDVTGKKMFAHAAFAEGIIAAENIAGHESIMDYKTVPVCMYCEPEVACVGLSEDEARQQGYNVAAGKFPLQASGRAITLGETDGFAKVVCDQETGEILGVHLIGPHVTELIGEAALAMKLECTFDEIGELIHPHPAISEALMEAARAVSNKTVHI